MQMFTILSLNARFTIEEDKEILSKFVGFFYVCNEKGENK